MDLFHGVNVVLAPAFHGGTLIVGCDCVCFHNFFTAVMVYLWVENNI